MSFKIFAIVITVLIPSVTGLLAQSATKVETVTGNIVAMQSRSRCPAECVFKGSFGTTVEYWIFRIADDTSGAKPRYIHVEYQVFKRGLSDAELNTFLTIRIKPFEDLDCNNRVKQGSFNDGDGWFRRPVRISDYLRIRSDNKDNLEDFTDFPCFYVNEFPVINSSNSEK